jgi:hypothetical protein
LVTKGRRLTASCALVLACALAPARALAQPQTTPPPEEGMEHATTSEAELDDVRARGAFRLGRQYYEQGQFAQAAQEFERAYGLSGRGQLLYNAYIAFRDAQDEENSARTLRGYLAHVQDAPDRVHLEARLAAIEQGIADRRAREEAQRAETEAARREAEEAARRAALPRTREIPGETWPWIVMGSGGALIVVGIITGGLAMAERGNLDSQCPLQLCPSGFGTEGRQSTIESLAITTDVLLIAGGVAAVTGLVFGIALGPHTVPIEPEGAQVSAACTADGCMAFVRGDL